MTLVCWRDGPALQQLPGATEGHAERTNQHEGEIINEFGLMRVQRERDGYVELEPIGEQAGDEDHGVPGAGAPQMQPQGVVQAEDRHDGGAGPEVVARNEDPEFAPGPAADVPEPARDRVARAAGQIALYPRSSCLKPLVLSRLSATKHGSDRYAQLVCS